MGNVDRREFLQICRLYYDVTDKITNSTDGEAELR